MGYTVSGLAKLSGLTPRTLRWYDSIGLLRPQRGPNSYREYAAKEVARLQQILFFREAGLELEQISAILDDEHFDAQAALCRHLDELVQRRDQLDALIHTAQNTLSTLKGENTMTDQEKFEGFKHNLVAENEAKYGAEVRNNWGEEAANASNAKMLNMTQEEYDSFMQLEAELNKALALAVAEGDPTGESAQRAADLHRQWLSRTFPSYSGQAHKGLAQMYVDDERFAAHYNKVASGAAVMLRDAINIYVDKNTQGK